jgi:hypothetical protein
LNHRAFFCFIDAGLGLAMAYSGLSVVLHLAAVNRINTVSDQIFVQLSKALSILDL